MPTVQEIDEMIMNFPVYCNCTKTPFLMNFVKIMSTFLWGRRYGLYICGRCKKRRRVKYVGGRTQFKIL